MILKNLLTKIKNATLIGEENTNITHLSQSLNTVTNGSLFFCYKGLTVDGHDLAKYAKSKGAVALVVERLLDIDLPQILVKKTRNIMPKICNAFYNNVLKKLTLIGVTGTNGKTTTANIIYQLLNLNNYKTGLIGTNGVEYLNFYFPPKLTTPDTVDLFEIFNKMSSSGIKYVVMEVSAHAMYFKKVLGCKFDVGILTNITQDHLDFFKSMYKYSLSKLEFLNKRYCKNCVVNVDDNYGRMFLKLINVKTISFALNNPARCFAIDVNLSTTKTTFVANVLDEVINVSVNLIGQFNVYNCLSALICCKILGLNVNQLQKINKIKPIKGRMNTYKLNNGAIAIVDFAHTPDGLLKVLQTIKEIKDVNSKIITVFGCGGNRDILKRPIMGKIAGENSDFVIITNDNPRNEPPQEIANQIIEGIENHNYCIELNRQNAIEKAINLSCPNDIVLIAGKGAEDYQEINNKKIKYNDKDVISLFV